MGAIVVELLSGQQHGQSPFVTSFHFSLIGLQGEPPKKAKGDKRQLAAKPITAPAAAPGNIQLHQE